MIVGYLIAFYIGCGIAGTGALLLLAGERAHFTGGCLFVGLALMIFGKFMGGWL